MCANQNSTRRARRGRIAATLAAAGAAMGLIAGCGASTPSIDQAVSAFVNAVEHHPDQNLPALICHGKYGALDQLTGFPDGALSVEQDSVESHVTGSHADVDMVFEISAYGVSGTQPATVGFDLEDGSWCVSAFTENGNGSVSTG